MSDRQQLSRREFLRLAGLTASGLALAGCTSALPDPGEPVLFTPPVAGRPSATMVAPTQTLLPAASPTPVPSATAALQPFRPDWEALQQYQVPTWYLQARLGLFIHWGVYAVPAFGSEWYPHEMYKPGSATYRYHCQHFGAPNVFGYKDFIPHFKAEHWDPEGWAAQFKACGAQYVLLTAEHHDGFPLYASDLTEWCASKMGPRRDLLGDLALALRRNGLRLGVSNHRAEHWHYFHTSLACDVQKRRFAGLYGPAQPKESVPDATFLQDWLARSLEVVRRYQPDLVYFDGGIHHPAYEPFLLAFAAEYYNLTRASGAVINYKYSAFRPGTAVLDRENAGFESDPGYPWQVDTSIGRKSWGYIQDEDYKPVGELIHLLVDTVSKGGRLLLNIGPRADGSLPSQVDTALVGIGDWLRVNGEAIFETVPWRVAQEGPTDMGAWVQGQGPLPAFSAQDIRFTCQGSNVYAICLSWPGQVLQIFSLSGRERVVQVKMLGSEAALDWKQQADGLVVRFPAEPPTQYAFVLKISCEPSSAL